MLPLLPLLAKPGVSAAVAHYLGGVNAQASSGQGGGGGSAGRGRSVSVVCGMHSAASRASKGARRDGSRSGAVGVKPYSSESMLGKEGEDDPGDDGNRSHELSDASGKLAS